MLTKLICGLIILGLLWLGDSLTDVRLPQGDKPAELYANQLRDDLKLTYSQAIREAEESVLLMTYSLTDQRIIRDLRKKAEQGIPVVVVCHGQASPGAAEQLGPKVRTTQRCGPGLMHQKIMIIDDKQVWLGSANMTPSSLRVYGNLVMGMEAPDIAATIAKKGRSMSQFGKALTLPYQTFQLGEQKLELIFLPDDRHAIERLKLLFDSAEKTIRVAMFTFTRQDLAESIVAAKKRGIQTEVVIDYNSGRGTSAKIIKLLKKGGVDVSLSSGQGLLHHKMLLIDDHILVNGSANWTQAAFTKNDDCMVILHDLTPTQKDLLERLWGVIQTETYES